MIWTCRVVQNAICDIVPCFLFDGGVCMGIIIPTRASKEPLVEGSRAVVLPGTNCYVLGR